MGRLRRAGGRWRLLAHEWVGAQPDGTTYGTAHHVTNDPTDRDCGPHSITHTLPVSTEFDELVVGQWLHVEQMSTGVWWMNVGGVTLWVTADRDGRAKSVTVYPAGEYDDPVPGCTYQDGQAPGA